MTGLVLGAIAVVAQLVALWFAVGIAVTALLLAIEMAPGGYANRA